VTTSTGAVVFNGAKAFSTTNNTAYEVTYRGTTGKGFVFEYNYSGDCASGTGKMTIVVVDN
jgi:hypothetical protein